MKIDDLVLIGVAVLGGLTALGYLVAIIIGVVQSGGILLPVLAAFVFVLALFVIVVRQRLMNKEDDHYEKIER